MTLYDFDTRTGPTGNRIVLGTLTYQFPIGDRIGSRHCDSRAGVT
jgi:hypothetical protein